MSSHFTQRRVSPMLIGVLLLFCADCSKSSQSATGAPISLTATPSSIPSTAQHALPPLASTPNVPPQTATALSTPTIPPEAGLNIRCLSIASAPNPSTTIITTGTVILKSEVIENDRYRPEAFLLNMATGARLQITKPNERLVDFVVSADRKRVAYRRILFDQQDKQIGYGDIVIANVDNHILSSIPNEKGWIGLAGWLGEQFLIINTAGNNPNENNGKVPPTLLALNPISGERRILRSDFPEIYHMHPLPEWGLFGLTMYDASLHSVVFAQSLSAGVSGYTLWDLTRHMAKTTIKSLDVSSIPLWSPNNAQFVVSADGGDLNPNGTIRGRELYSVQASGDSPVQLTHLSAYFPRAEFGAMSWSPNGKYLAFWLFNFEPAIPEHLAIFDISSRKMADYCVPGDWAVPPGPETIPSPIWSPDSTKLIVQNRYNNRSSRVILVDFINERAVELAENMAPVGWMDNSP